jgi:hypothetical protein
VDARHKAGHDEPEYHALRLLLRWAGGRHREEALQRILAKRAPR